MATSVDAKKIIEHVGGKSNIKQVTHCTTRLRFNLVDNSKANKEELEALGILGVADMGTQYQVIVGPTVEGVYKEIIGILGTSFGKGAVDDEAEGPVREPGVLNAIKFYGNKVFDVISGSFTPIIPAFCGAAIVKAILSICTMTGCLAADSSTYAVLSAASNSIFYFLPIVLSVSMARKIGANPYLAAAVSASLLEPNFTALGGNGEMSSFMGLPMVLMSYASTVFPAMLSTTLLFIVESLLKRVVYKDLQVVIVPTLCLLVVVPVTMLLVGPFGFYVGQALSNFVMWLMATMPVPAGFILGSIWMFVVLFGLHWAIIPVLIANIAALGSDPVMAALDMTIFAAAGAAAGVFIKAKNPQLKSVAFSTIIPALLGGITEPVIYGISLRYRKSMVIMCLMTGVAAAFVAATGCGEMSTAGGFPSIVTATNIPMYCVGCAIAFFGTAALHVVLGFGEKSEEELR